jgi:hypothetical protein
MTIQVLSDVIMPNSAILAGVAGSYARANVRTTNPAGYASANALRDVTLRTYQIGISPMNAADALAIQAIREVTDSGVYGMLMEDPIDFTVSAAQGALQGYMLGAESGGVGVGNGCPTYGIRKLYLTGSRAKARAITRPRANPVLLRNGSPVTYGVAAGNVAASAGPVILTFVPDASSNVSSVTVGATTQVVLSGALAGLVITTGKLWLQGLTGADAALLNNQSHTITAIAGATYTLATNTAGKTITPAGQGQKYPQPTDTLTCSCDFYVPVHFRDDTMDWEIVAAGQRDARMVSIPSTYLDEVREA